MDCSVWREVQACLDEGVGGPTRPQHQDDGLAALQRDGRAVVTIVGTLHALFDLQSNNTSLRPIRLGLTQVIGSMHAMILAQSNSLLDPQDDGLQCMYSECAMMTWRWQSRLRAALHFSMLYRADLLYRADIESC